jgi:hypothetical protein
MVIASSEHGRSFSGDGGIVRRAGDSSSSKVPPA